MPWPGNWLSHSQKTRSRPVPSAVGSAAPSIHSGCGSPAIAQKVGARSTWPTGSSTSAGATPADGAGRQTNGSRMSDSVWYGPLNSRP